jgi:hypothetical protein
MVMNLRDSFVFKVTALAMVVFFPVVLLADECREAEIQGSMDASAQHSTSGWFLGGVGSGVLLGLIGTGVITGAAALSNPKPEFPPAGFDQNCYMHGYSKKAKSKNTISALVGGLTGTAVFVFIYISAKN